jgi:polysaccharide biosynthesis/export protein
MAGKLHVPHAAVWLLAMLAILVGCSSPPPTYPFEKEPNPLEQEYVIGAADDVMIRVWKHDEFAMGHGVRPDGFITIPLIGDVMAAGRTPSQLEADVKNKLRTFVKGEPVVTITVTGINSYTVTVSGRVASPGRFASQNYLTVAEAVALAGGPTRFAAPEDAFVLRRKGNGDVRRIPINYGQIVRGEYLQQNIYLMRGDQVIIP